MEEDLLEICNQIGIEHEYGSEYYGMLILIEGILKYKNNTNELIYLQEKYKKLCADKG